MLKDNLNFLMSVTTALVALLAFGATAYAVPGDLEIRVDKNSDLTREPVATNLTTETRVSEEKEKHADHVAIGASFMNLGHPSIATSDQVSNYNLSGGVGADFEYSHSFGAMHLTGTVGYNYIQQTSAPSATALHVIPIGLMGEYYYKGFSLIRPFVGAGVMGIFQSQRGIDEDNVTDFNTLPLLTAGVDVKTPWDVRLHARVRQLLPQAAAADGFYGQIYDVGFSYSL